MKHNALAVALLVLLIASYNASLASEYITGTGFMVSSDGFVLTNRHVVENCADPIEVRYVVSGSSRSVVVAKGKVLDLALLETGFRNVPYLRLRATKGKVSYPIRSEIIHTVGFIGDVPVDVEKGEAGIAS